MKTYKFTTRDAKREDVQDYKVECYSLNEAKKYAKNIVGNSRDNEMSHSRIKLA